MDRPAETPDFSVVDPDEVPDAYAGTDVPGEFRSLSDALHSREVALSLIRVPPHCDFGQGTGHSHDEIEELYLLTRGTLTMRWGEEIRQVSAPAAVRVGAATVRSHRNEGDEPVEMWAISRRGSGDRGHKVDDFWAASPEARQHRSAA